MARPHRPCPDCDALSLSPTRRDFLKTAGAGVAVAAVGGLPGPAPARESADAAPETAVRQLYDSLSAKQRSVVAFDWNHTDDNLGLLRTRVSANWRITEPPIKSQFYTRDQQQLMREIFLGMLDPAWHERFDKQLKDDDQGFGTNQTIAIFGKPGDGKFQFVLTGRHMTLRCDGNSADHVAFGGPIFYGHAADGNFNETANHPGNVFWPQAVAANELFEMLDGRQRDQALVVRAPHENAVGFQGSGGDFSGIPIAELAGDQREHAQLVLRKLLEPYRQSDRDEVVACLKKQGGLDGCHLTFYKQGDIGGDSVWDIWRLEGPSFVWHFRGSPHVHTWVHVADDPSVKLNS